MKYLVQISRILVGILFIISGFIKLNDPLGFSYKLQEYFSEEVLNLPFLISYALGISVFVVIAEVVLGVFLLIGYKRKFTVLSLLGMILFFTFLTFYSAYFDKVKDCGCFGDALKLTPWESFTKDVILLVLILILFFGIKHIKPLFNKFGLTVVALLSFIACLGFAYYVLMHLPAIDFRAYKIGDNIQQNMTLPEDAQKEISEWTWTFNVDGEEKEFVTNGSYPEVDGEYVGYTKKILVEADEPKIFDFSIENEESDFTEPFLEEDNLIVFTSYNLNSANGDGLVKIKSISDQAIISGYKVIGLTASGYEDIQHIKDTYNLNFDFYLCDEKVVKTIVRSNPGVIELNKGTVMQKEHWNDFEDLKFKHDEYKEINNERRPVQNKGNLTVNDSTASDSILNFNNLYNKFINENDSISAYNYLMAFPNDFEQFKKYFDFNDELNIEMVLYSNSEKYIKEFFEAGKFIDKKLIIEKVINLTQNAKWNADAINYFQNEIETLFKDDRDIFCNALKNRTEQGQRYFWHFYFDGPHSKNKTLPVLDESCHGLSAIMLEENKKVINDWKNH